MGTGDGVWFEGPPHSAEAGAFFMDRHEVTNRQFTQFVDATGYATEAEGVGWALVFDVATRAWGPVDGADWRHPEGNGSTIEGREDHPVVHVSLADATAYAAWAGKRLPTEAEWEWAARGGMQDAKYPWGDELTPGGRHLANIWQGRFPDHDDAADGFASTAPVGQFAPNGYGLHDMAGNVWEWTADRFAPYPAEPARDDADAAGPAEQVIRGGSWMCSANYCSGYRVAARQKTEPDSALNNLGFRCARDLD